MRTAKYAFTVLVGLLVSLLFVVTVQGVRAHGFKELTDSVIVESEIAVVVSVVLLLATFVLLSEAVRQLRVSRSVVAGNGLKEIRVFSRAIAWITGIAAINSPGVIARHQPTSFVHGVAADSVLSPVAASAVLSHILRRRREQLMNREFPRLLTVQECDVLGSLQELAAQCESPVLDEVEYVVTPDVHTLLTAVDRTEPMSTAMWVQSVTESWLVEVKVFGYPVAVSIDGTVAEFRKKRSLELLTWLALNRDRSRRSTARTAMWDLDISDASFSTVVSDLRRGLREVHGNQEEVNFLPTTYSDELPLSPRVITDADRLQSEHAKFKLTGEMTESLRNLLRGMRDVPFAGTAYSWADLDGTTTRLVMSALVITVDIATAMLKYEDFDSAVLATSAGLRVFPGCDELLALQEQCLMAIRENTRL